MNKRTRRPYKKTTTRAYVKAKPIYTRQYKDSKTTRTVQGFATRNEALEFKYKAHQRKNTDISELRYNTSTKKYEISTMKPSMQQYYRRVMR